MSETLYPLKFTPIFKEKIWGGDKLQKILQKNTGNLINVGESWEISSVQDNISEVANGFLAGNSLEEIIEVYMGDLVGEKVYSTYGLEFPLLIKFIDASDDLSIQVHPDDALARQRHQAYGKTEMWYVLDADNGAKLISGFNKETSKAEYLDYLNNKKLPELLNHEEVAPGDVFFIPAGRVHAIGKGILLAEIQQTSDVTYRIYDYNRTDAKGNKRELHTDLALDAIDYQYYKDYRTHYKKKRNTTTNVITSGYFTTNMLEFDAAIKKDYTALDSFVIYMAVDGNFSVNYGNHQSLQVQRGETVLLPNVLKHVTIEPQGTAKLLEVYIPGGKKNGIG